VLVALSRLRGGPPVVWPWLGAAVESPSAAHGAVVWSVAPGSPAAGAGLRPGDRIVSIDGRAVDHFLAAMLQVLSRPIGTPFELAVVHAKSPPSDAPARIRVVSAMRPADPALPPLDIFERETGVRLGEVAPSKGKQAALQVLSVGAPRPGASPLSGSTSVVPHPGPSPLSGSIAVAVGSRLVAMVPGLGLVRELELGRTDQQV